MPRTNVRSSLRLAAMAALLAGAAMPALAQQTPSQAPATDTTGQAPAAQAPAAPAPAPQAQQAPADANQPAPAAQGQRPAAPQPQVVATHGDWSILCLNGQPPCIMRQIGYNADGRDIMEISIRRIEPQQTQQGTVEAVMDVRVPLGVLLREGVGVQIDTSKPQRGQYSICLNEGCLMREPLPNAMIASMKKGAAATFNFVAPQGQGMSKMEAKISLSGFTAAYNALDGK